MPVFKRYGKEFQIYVNEIMTSPAVTVVTTSTLREVSETMWAKKVGSLAVVDRSEKLAGIITERDIIYCAAKDLFQKRDTTAEAVMSKNAITVAPDEDIVSAVEKMRNHNIRHLPVTNSERKPVGMLTLRDILDVSMELLGLFRPPDLG